MSKFLNRVKIFGRQTDEEQYEGQIKKWFPIASVIGIIVGIVMALFYLAFFSLFKLFSFFHPIFGMIMGGLAILILVKYKISSARNNGISYVITKRHREELVPLNTGSEKFFSSTIAIGSGLPVGREGPALIIGSAVASKLVSWTHIPESLHHRVITLGSAASTGALFQAPFGAAIFAAEVPYKEDADGPILMPAFLASVIAAVTSRFIIDLVDEALFSISLEAFKIGVSTLEFSVRTTILAIVLGFLTGIIGRGFVDFYYFYRDRFLIRFDEIMGLIIGLILGILLILIGFLISDDYYLLDGINSFAAIANIITDGQNTGIELLVLFIVLQILATTALIGAGYPGGIFGPSLAIGALTGIAFANLLGIDDVGLITSWAIIGMSGSHAATTKTPIASVLLILEITGLPNLIIPLILVNLASYISSGPRSLYSGQLRSRDAAVMRELKEYDQHSGFTVQEVMTKRKSVIFTTPQMTVETIKELVSSTSKRDFPVIKNDHDYTFMGFITEDVILRTQNKNSILEELMITNYATLKAEMTGDKALQIMLDQDIERAPVVDKENRLIGIVSISDIVTGHHQLLDEEK